jgi:hypothetical protein
MNCLKNKLFKSSKRNTAELLVANKKIVSKKEEHASLLIIPTRLSSKNKEEDRANELLFQ